MKLLQARVMVHVWKWIDYLVRFILRNVYTLQDKDWTDYGIYSWYLRNITAAWLYHEIKLDYTRDGLWPPRVAEGGIDG